MTLRPSAPLEESSGHLQNMSIEKRTDKLNLLVIYQMIRSAIAALICQ